MGRHFADYSENKQTNKIGPMLRPRCFVLACLFVMRFSSGLKYMEAHTCRQPNPHFCTFAVWYQMCKNADLVTDMGFHRNRVSISTVQFGMKLLFRV